jgi:hypothetical protein
MAKHDEDLAYILSKHGTPNSHGPLPASSVMALEGRAPSFLLEIWQRYGRFDWFDGGFQVVDPLRYMPLLDRVFAGDADFDPKRMIPFALGPFGQIEIWDETLGIITLMTLPNWVFCGQLFKPKPLNGDTALTVVLVMANDRSFDREDETTGRMMFRALKKTHGALPADHIFAPRLHPALGGQQTAANFRPAPALEAIALIHQAEPFRLIDTSTPEMRPVRQIRPT